MLLNVVGQSSGQIADLLKAPRTKVSQWLANYAAYGTEGLLAEQRSGRPPRLLETQRRALGDIIESRPVAYGLDTGVWTAPMIARIIEEEFNEAFHQGHVRKLLAQVGFSVQRPRRSLARADLTQYARRRRRIYPNIKKAQREGCALLFADEASFRQDSTLHATWSRVGCKPQVPVTVQRNNIKIYGAVELYTRQNSRTSATTYSMPIPRGSS